MRYVDQLLHSFNGSAAWIFGKGPSLDHFSFDTAGPLRICINESLRAVPDPTFFFSHDEGPIKNVADDWPLGCGAILQMERARLALSCGIEQSSIYIYEKKYCDNNVRDMDAAGIAKHRSLYGNSGTVHSAIHFCRLLGVSEIIMVGFDGAGGYADCLDLPAGGAEHERIRRDSISLLKSMGFRFRFFSADKHGCSASEC